MAVAALLLVLALPRPGIAAREAPAFLRLQTHALGDVDPRLQPDEALQARLDALLCDPELGTLAARGDLGIALVDLSDASSPGFAEINGSEMLYSASIPKIAALYAAFQARKEKRLRIDDALRCDLTNMCRVSSNVAASKVIQRVGFNYINSVLWQSGLYDPAEGGGLWVGKAYGGVHDYWHRDPLHSLSHGATALSVAKLLTLIAQERLVDRRSSLEMKDMLGSPGIHHKFVRGLDARPGSIICRKSGSWREWHGDSALVERGTKRYVAVALCHSPAGDRIVERLILALDDCIVEQASGL